MNAIPCAVIVGIALFLPGCASQTATAPSAVVAMAGVASVTPEQISRTVVIGRSTKSDVLAALGETRAIQFDNGYEVWVYRLKDPMSRNASCGAHGGRPAWVRSECEGTAEFVILFAPSGIVSRTRIRA